MLIYFPQLRDHGNYQRAKKIQDAIGELTEFDTRTKEEIWDWIEPLLSKQNQGESVTSIS